MVEFESLAERLYRVVRQAAKETGKQVRLDIVGGSIEVDRGVLERMIVGPSSTCCATAWRTASKRRPQRAGRRQGRHRRDPRHRHAGRQRVGVDCRDDGAGLDLAAHPPAGTGTRPAGARPGPTDAELANLIFSPASAPPNPR
jgi:chemosensory pili system protein ChpA (sensor histidine kinase/response regulator)